MTIYFRLEEEDGIIRMIDNAGIRYDLPVLAHDPDKAIKGAKYVMKHDDKAFKVVYDESGTAVDIGTGHISKFTGQSDMTIPTASASMPEVEENISEEQLNVMSFIHKDAVGMKPDRLFLSEVKWKYLVRSVMRGKNIMFTGASGSGKTFAVQTLAKVFSDKQSNIKLRGTKKEIEDQIARIESTGATIRVK
jgi:ABC-type multidrug transport system fused ATPase/permease subunit